MTSPRKVAVVNEAFVREFLPDEKRPDSRTFSFDDTKPEGGEPTYIVGVVRDIRHKGIQKPAKPTVYVAIDQVPNPSWPTILVRTQAPPMRWSHPSTANCAGSARPSQLAKYAPSASRWTSPFSSSASSPRWELSSDPGTAAGGRRALWSGGLRHRPAHRRNRPAHRPRRPARPGGLDDPARLARPGSARPRHRPPRRPGRSPRRGIRPLRHPARRPIHLCRHRRPSGRHRQPPPPSSPPGEPHAWTRAKSSATNNISWWGRLHQPANPSEARTSLHWASRRWSCLSGCHDPIPGGILRKVPQPRCGQVVNLRPIANRPSERSSDPP